MAVDLMSFEQLILEILYSKLHLSEIEFTYSYLKWCALCIKKSERKSDKHEKINPATALLFIHNWHLTPKRIRNTDDVFSAILLFASLFSLYSFCNFQWLLYQFILPLTFGQHYTYSYHLLKKNDLSVFFSNNGLCLA